MIGSSTPISLLFALSQRHLEILHLFDDCIDFWDEDSDGWALVRQTADRDNFTLHQKPFIPHLLRKYRREMSENICQNNVLDLLIFSCGSNMESFKMCLALHEDAANFTDGREGLLHYIARTIDEQDEEEAALYVNYMLQKGANIHLVVYGETPTSSAMTSSMQFRKWIALLQRTPIRDEELIAGELASAQLPLSLRGWTKDSLRTLIMLSKTPLLARRTANYQFLEEDANLCCRMLTTTRCYGADIEPWWDRLLEMILAQKCVCGFLKETYFRDIASTSSWSTASSGFSDGGLDDRDDITETNSRQGKGAEHTPQDGRNAYFEQDSTSHSIAGHQCYYSPPIDIRNWRLGVQAPASEEPWGGRAGQAADGCPFPTSPVERRKWYYPQEAYCWSCYEFVEGLEKDDSDSGESVVPLMPGSYVYD